MQQFIGLCSVRNISCGVNHAVYQSGVSTDTCVRFHAEIVLIALLGRVHLRVAFSLFILRRTGHVNDRSIDDSAVAQQ